MVPLEPLFVVRGELPLTVAQTNELLVFVEDETGRPFQYPPTIVVQNPTDFAAGLEGASLTPEDDPALVARSLQALGLTDQGVDQLTQTLGRIGDLPVAGYYDSVPDELFIPNNHSQRFFARVLVHELVHALDGQYSDLANWEVREQARQTGNNETINALHFVIEGRASVIEHGWQWPDRWDTADAPTTPDSGLVPTPQGKVPDALFDQLRARYSTGQIFIRAVGGVSQTHDLLDNPPATTEEVLFPATAGQPVIEVATPKADGPVLQTRYVGAFDLAFILHGRGNAPVLGQGWAGGASVLWGDDTTTCIRVAVATDSLEDRDRLFKVFERWQPLGDDRTAVIEDGLIVATSCAPLIR